MILEWARAAAAVFSPRFISRVEKIEANIHEALEKIEKIAAVADACVQEVRDQRRGLAALQVMDPDFGTTGKLILCARISGQDKIKIMNIPRDVAISQYSELMRAFEHTFKGTVV